MTRGLSIALAFTGAVLCHSLFPLPKDPPVAQSLYMVVGILAVIFGIATNVIFGDE